MKKVLGIGCLGVIAIMAILIVVGSLVPKPKCGEVGYYPKLSLVCREGTAHANPERYCSEDEMRDWKCAAATIKQQREEDMEDMRRKLYERH